MLQLQISGGCGTCVVECAGSVKEGCPYSNRLLECREVLSSVRIFRNRSRNNGFLIVILKKEK